MTLADISPLASVAALALSLFTLWFTILRRGTVRSTHPSFIAVRYDFVGKKAPQAKVFLRTLLFSTAKRGHVVEMLFLRVGEGGRRTEFSFWGHGDKELIRGSGLFVPESGVATNHHFNPLDAEALFLFSGGVYSLELVAKLVGSKKLVSLWAIELEMPAKAFGSSIAKDTAVFYSWSPQHGRYVASIESRTGAVHALSDPGG
jgi:hypothetical protein